MNIVRFHTYKFVLLQKQNRCRFFQWIDGPETFNPHILLFPYDRSESCPLRSFKCWVPLPPNSPPMTDEEKDEATTCRICHPPPCKCGYLLELAKPPLRLDYTPFELGYGYLYCNIVGEDDAWVSSKTQAFINNHLYVQSPSLMMIFLY
jgi:hypothetical protein